MDTLKFILIFLLFGLCACKQKNAKPKISSDTVLLSDKIVPLINFIDNPDSCQKAVLILDSATAIDSNCFLCYYNKLMFLNTLKQYDKIIIAINNSIRLRPNAFDLYLKGGLFYEKLRDTISSQHYFQKSLLICSSVLDTMNVTHSDYFMLASNKAVNLIMLGEQSKANELLRRLYIEEKDEEIKKSILLMMNKSKTELLEILTSNQNSS